VLDDADTSCSSNESTQNAPHTTSAAATQNMFRRTAQLWQNCVRPTDLLKPDTAHTVHTLNMPARKQVVQSTPMLVARRTTNRPPMYYHPTTYVGALKCALQCTQTHTEDRRTIVDAHDKRGGSAADGTTTCNVGHQTTATRRRHAQTEGTCSRAAVTLCSHKRRHQ
jgi:hypothetical protein